MPVTLMNTKAVSVVYHANEFLLVFLSKGLILSLVLELGSS